MIGRMPAPLRARDRFLRLLARRVDHADQPEEDQLLLDVARRLRRARARPPAARGRRRRACAAPRRPAPRWPPGSRARRSVGQRPRLFADQLVRAARQQHVRRALGEDEQALLLLGVACGPCSSACARRRRALRRRAAKRASSASSSSPALRAATISAPSVGSPCTVQRPSRSCSTALLARSAAASARTQLDAQRAVDRRRRRPAAPRPRARSRCRPSRTRPLAVTTARTVISFFVSVPVLSEAMTLAEPSVSTAARWRTIALRFAMRCTPSASTAVTTAGKPSGTAATASATPRMSTSKIAAEPAHVLDEDDRGDHHDGDDDDDDARAACRRGRAPSAAAWSRSRRCLQHPGDAAHLGLHAGRRDHRPCRGRRSPPCR